MLSGADYTMWRAVARSGAQRRAKAVVDAGCAGDSGMVVFLSIPAKLANVADLASMGAEKTENVEKLAKLAKLANLIKVEFCQI